MQDLRRIGLRLRAEARQVLREHLGGLSRMGLDTVESATYLGCAFLNALLEEAPSVKAERFVGGWRLSMTDRNARRRGSRPGGPRRILARSETETD